MTDAIDLKTAVFHSRNVADWPIVTDFSGVEFRDADPAGGVRPIVDIPWPGVIPAGWDGPITYAIWLGRKIGAQWHLACALEFYPGKVWTGAPLNSGYTNWFNVGKGFGELETLPNVQPGEKLLFMVTAGSQRLKDTSVQPGSQSRQERSNVIMVTFTANGVVLAEAPSQRVPTDPPQLPPIVPPVSAPCVDDVARAEISKLYDQVQRQEGRLVALESDRALMLARLSALTTAPVPLPAPPLPVPAAPAPPVPPPGDTGSAAGQAAGQILGGLLSGWLNRKK